MQGNPLANEQVYSFYSGRAVVTKKGNIAVAQLFGVQCTVFKSGDNFVQVPFVGDYPELLPKQLALNCGLLFKSNSANYICTLELATGGGLAIAYKNSVTERSTAFPYNDYSVYGSLCWMTN